MTPPEMAGWNLALRFGLELTALAGLAAAAWKLTSGGMRWVTVVIVTVGAAIVWGTFNVLDDPSRSGSAPVEVPGWTRLAIELLIFVTGATGLAVAEHPDLATGCAVLIACHYMVSWDRIRWLLTKKGCGASIN